ncbi:MAG TPA: hypothetical protein VFA18_22070, partial [Gemmataceae bacterium]|nr:hypothetical protein [Gemmataceae bacterium]
MPESSTLRPLTTHHSPLTTHHSPRILFLAHRVPYPPDKGDRIRTFHLLKSLAGHATIHLACLADEPPAPDALPALERLCERVMIAPLNRWMRLTRTVTSLAVGRTATEGAFWSGRL